MIDPIKTRLLTSKNKRGNHQLCGSYGRNSGDGVYRKNDYIKRLCSPVSREAEIEES